MANKELKARLSLKYDLLSEWQKTTTAGQGGNLVLNKGEVAFVEIPSGSSLEQTVPPAIMFKVGNGTDAFKDLPWVSGVAADVYAWAKKSGIEVETSGSGSFVSNVSWNASNNKLTITKSSSLSGYVPTTRTVAGHALSANITVEELRSALGAINSITINGTKKTTTNGAVDLGTFLTSADISGKQDSVISISAIDATTVEDALVEAKQAGLDAQKTANAKYAKPSTGIPKTDLASAVQTSLGKADTSVQSVSLASGTNNGTVKLMVNGTATDNIAVKGLAAGAYKSVDTSISSGTSNLITSSGVKTYVDTKVSGSVRYMGTVATLDALALKTPSNKGDFCRASATFTLSSSYSATGANVAIHASDMLICETIKDVDDSLSTTYSVIHGEIDSNTWVANSKSAAGYVAAGGSNASMVWKTDADGNPAWRADVNQTIKAGSTTFGSSDVVEIAAGSNVTVTPDATNKKITIASTYTDTKVTSAANHYAPSADSASQLSVDASSTTSASWGSTSLVTGVNLQRDAKGHVTGVTVDSIRMPSNPNTNTNQMVRVGATIFDANDSVDMQAGTGLKVSASNGTQGSEYIKYDIDDAVVFVLDCGSATTNIS